MINVDLGRSFLGSDLVEIVGSAMGELDGFKVYNGSGYELDFSGEEKEVRRRLVARRPYRSLDLFVQAWQDKEPPFGPFNYFFPVLGQAAYASYFLDKDDGACVFDTTLDFNLEYEKLPLIIRGRLEEEILSSDECYQYVEKDVKMFVNRLKENLGVVA